MRKKMRHSEVRDLQLWDLQTDCNQCVLKTEEVCPYLETIVNCHLFNDLKSRRVFNGFKKEKRLYPRIITSIPAFISNDGSGKENLHIGSITDISLGGLRISIPRGMKHEVLTARQTPEFEIITKLPDENTPIHLKCKSQRVVYSKDNIHVGASIVDADSRSYKSFKNYLM
ncbi:MAG TPA: PilZ domain-containing protein [Syntrophales bacterium]|nr:PilZ domain-containing protein [Syntrophales bacterium]